MFHSIPKWSIWFWNITGVISINGYCNKWQVILSVLLLISCVYNIYITPVTICILEGECNNSLSTKIKGLFIRVEGTTCLISRIVILLKGKHHLAQYKKNVEKFYVITPMTHSEIKVVKNMSYIFIIISLLLTVPANLIRVWDLTSRSDYSYMTYIFMYIQNYSMYCVETHFTILCFILHHKFVEINRDLMALKIDTIVRNNYPFMTQMREKYGKSNNTRDYNAEILRSLAAGRPMADFVEQLKLKHKSIRDAVKNLNDFFGVHLGLSICALCLFAMFDLYYFIIGVMTLSRYTVIIYIWILQYTVRFGSYTIVAHLTTKQAMKSKMLITDINNRSLDINSKEELRLFLNQVSNCVVEFTACDFVTINTHLITSATATCSTYLIILLQFYFIQRFS